MKLCFLFIGSYDKWFCIKSWQKFANLFLLCKAPSKKRLSERCRKHRSVIVAIPGHLLIMKTCLFKYIENFITQKKGKFLDKNSDIFHISAQNIDCGYSLEPPRQGGSNEYPQCMFLEQK